MEIVGGGKREKDKRGKAGEGRCNWRRIGGDEKENEGKRDKYTKR